MNQKQSNDELEIDLLEVAGMLLEKWHYLLVCFLAGAVLFNAFAFFGIKPTYESTAKLYIVTTSENSVVNLNDLNLGTSLTSDYEQLMLSYPVLDKVIKKLDLNTTSENLKKAYTLTNPDDTRILEIKATSTDPEKAKELADTMAEVAMDYLPDTMSAMTPNFAQHAKVADHKANPSYGKYTIMGALLGLIACAGVLIAGYLMDDTIHSSEDMEKYFDLVPLTSIPDSDLFIESESDMKKTRKRWGRR